MRDDLKDGDPRSIRQYRDFLKADLWEKLRGIETDQKQKIPAPPVQNPVPGQSRRIDLTKPEDLRIGDAPLIEILKRRRSRRSFVEDPLSLDELSFLLWATQGINKPGAQLLRTVPSAGARHPFETHIFVRLVDGLEPGIYRYLPVDHQLCLLFPGEDLTARVVEACYSQKFVAGAALVFMWTANPYRAEWRYSIIAHKMIAVDAGHVCQNLYLAGEAIGAGTCAIGAYHQEKMDALLGLDGDNEFTIYAACLGRVDSTETG